MLQKVQLSFNDKILVKLNYSIDKIIQFDDYLCLLLSKVAGPLMNVAIPVA